MEKQLRVLYAEDDPDIQMIASMALEDIGGLNVHLCADGNEAIEQYAEIQPDVLLLDVMMPDKDGPAALSELQTIYGDKLSPTIFITAKASSKEVERLLSFGACGVITKPFDPMALAEEVTALYEKSKNKGSKRGASKGASE